MKSVQYVILFLEGIITFISPCLLPMLPIYVSYFAVSNGNAQSKPRAFVNALGFVFGFTLVFALMGAFAGSAGRLLIQYQKLINIITGGIVVMLGLGFLGILKLPMPQNARDGRYTKNMGFISAIVFGIVFSISWTPCVGTFLGSALMLAAQKASMAEGILLLIAYSLGLGIPFLASAVLIEKLKAAFDFIKSNYRVINIVSGSLLVIMGILMMTGYMGAFLSDLAF